MSGFNTPNAGRQPTKQMSSRLMNMKFMQRAAAASPASTPQTPSTEPPAKRRRVDTSGTSSPGTPLVTSTQPAEFVDIARGGTSTFTPSANADTEWVLELKPLPIEVEDEDEDEGEISDAQIWTNQSSGRQTFGGFKKRKPHTDASSESGEWSEEDNGQIDSDEEMRRVRRAIETKHRAMAGTADKRPPPPVRNSGSGFGDGVPPPKPKFKGREQGAYKVAKRKKQSRKTI